VSQNSRLGVNRLTETQSLMMWHMLHSSAIQNLQQLANDERFPRGSCMLRQKV